MRFLIALFTMLAAVGVAHAQSTLTQNLSAQKLPTFSGNLGLGYNSNLYRPSDYDSQASVSGDLTLNYRVKNGNLIRSYVGGFKETTQGQEWRPNDGWVGWVNNAFWYRSNKVVLGQQVRFSMPLSRESRDRDTKLTGVSLVPVAIVTLSPAVTFIYQPQLIKNFHTYQQNRAGSNNTEYAFNHTFVGSISLSDRFYFQPVLVYGDSWTYGGTRKDPIYQVAGEVGYGINNQFTVAAGWSNGGAFRRFEQGSDQTLEVFNNNTSSVYTALYWVF